MTPEQQAYLESLTPEQRAKLKEKLRARKEVTKAPEVNDVPLEPIPGREGPIEGVGSLLDKWFPGRLDNMAKLEAAKAGGADEYAAAASDLAPHDESVLGLVGAAGAATAGAGKLLANPAKDAARNLWAHKEGLKVAGQMKNIGGLEEAAEMTPELIAMAREAAPVLMEKGGNFITRHPYLAGAIGTGIGLTWDKLKQLLSGK